MIICYNFIQFQFFSIELYLSSTKEGLEGLEGRIGVVVPVTEAIGALKHNGIIKEHPTGGHIIESFNANRSLLFTLPSVLKNRPLQLWTEEDRLWLNT